VAVGVSRDTPQGRVQPLRSLRSRIHAVWMRATGVHVDVTAYLSLWLALLFGIPAQQVLGPLGAIGSPAFVAGLPVIVWWVSSRAVPELGVFRGPLLLRSILLAHAWYMLVSYAVALSRPTTELELSGATRAAITTVMLTCIALIVLDGIPHLHRLVTLLRRTVWAGAFMGMMGVAQFFTGRDLRFPLPGLVWNRELDAVEQRSIFNRPAGTAMHPIEFSVVAAALLPLAVHFALHAPKGPKRQVAVAAAVLIGLGVPFSISRSGIVALAGALVVMFTGWHGRRRLNGALVLIGSIPLLWLLVPGLIGTLRGMFTWFDDDPSIQSRRDRVPRIIALIRQRPWAGLGNGTWSIEDYFLIDNELYVTTLETGLIGLSLTIVLLSAGILAGLWCAHARFATSETASLGRALAAGITALAFSLFTFDAFHYRILTGVLFLFIGAAGALWRLTSRAPTGVQSFPPTMSGPLPHRRSAAWP
jgi:hypothetical protein